jgi:hypothetical protein
MYAHHQISLREEIGVISKGEHTHTSYLAQRSGFVGSSGDGLEGEAWALSGGVDAMPSLR